MIYMHIILCMQKPLCMHVACMLIIVHAICWALGLVLLVATWNCWISCKNGYAGLLVLLAAFLEPLAHCQNVASLSRFYKYYFGRCLSEMAQLVPFPYSQGRSTCYSDRLHDFFIAIPRCYRDVCVNSFFPCTARFWNSVYIMFSFDQWFKWL